MPETESYRRILENLFEEFFPFIWFGLISIVIVIFLYKFSDMIKVKFQYQKKEKNYTNSKEIDDQMTGFIKNAPRLLIEVEQEIETQRSKGVTDEQMKSLIQKKSMMSFIVQNKEIIDIIGKPILKKLVGFIKAI